MIILDFGSEWRYGQPKFEQHKYNYTGNTEGESVSKQ
jgi:hypothetical protein